MSPGTEQPSHRQSNSPHEFVLLEGVARLNNLAFVVAGAVIWSYTFLLIVKVGAFRASTALHGRQLDLAQRVGFIQRAARLVAVLHTIVINHSLRTLLRGIFAREIKGMYGLLCAIISRDFSMPFCTLVAINLLLSNYQTLSPRVLGESTCIA